MLFILLSFANMDEPTPSSEVGTNCDNLCEERWKLYYRPLPAGTGKRKKDAFRKEKEEAQKWINQEEQALA